MSGLNSFCGCGRLVSDASALNTQQGGARFRMAIDGYRKEETLFLDCTKFGNVGNVIQYLKKGTPVAVSGSLRPNEYTDRTGQVVRGLQLVVFNLQLVGRRTEDTLAVPSDFQQHGGQTQNGAYPQGYSGEGDPEDFTGSSFDDTDIPF